MAKLGIALGSGPRGLGFDSRHSDHSGADDCLLRISFSPESWKNHPLTDIYKYAMLLIIAVDCTGLGRNPEPVAFGCCFFLDIFSVLCYVVCIEGSPYISPIALCVVAVVGDPSFSSAKGWKNPPLPLLWIFDRLHRIPYFTFSLDRPLSIAYI